MDLRQFEIKILPLKNKIYRLAHALLGNVTDAEDAVQDIYLKLWSVRDELEKADNITALSLQIARNHCIDRIRKQHGLYYNELTDDNLSTDPSPYEQTEQRDMVGFVRKMIERLPEQQRMVMLLRDVEGMEMDEIATVTGLTENAIKVYLSRARQRIREALLQNNHAGQKKN
jgi:RNA polymerase sigma-70 factor (ECF subfamily)